MKSTYISFLFTLFSLPVLALECENPLICTTRASEICTQQKLKLFGEDECVKCGCDPKATLVEKDGQKACCGIGDYKGMSFVGTALTLNPLLCGCPMNGVASVFEGEAICCGTGTLNGYQYNEDSYMYEKKWKTKCCPVVDGQMGSLLDGTCCLNYKAYNETTKKYDITHGNCSCPLVNEKKGGFGTDYATCCFNGKAFNEVTKDYDLESSVCCPVVDGSAGSSLTEGVCCRNRLAYNETTKKYDQLNPGACGCPDFGERKNDNSTCCDYGLEYNTETKNYDQLNIEVCGCPELGEKVDNSTCCNDGFAYNETTKKYDAENEKCCPASSDGSSVFHKNGTCCRRGYVYNEITKQYDQYDPVVCGCPGFGEMVGGMCCDMGFTYNQETDKYDQFNPIVCGCPINNFGEKGKLMGDEVCCLKGLAFGVRKEKDYTVTDYHTLNIEVCGCPENGTEKDGIICCKNGKFYNEETRKYDGISVEACGCPDDGTEKNGGVCCKDGNMYNEETKKYDIPSMELCGCPEGGTEKDEGICCKDGLAYNGTTQQYDQFYPTICGCPVVDKRKGNLGSDNKTCCLNGRKYNDKTKAYDIQYPDLYDFDICCQPMFEGMGKCCPEGVMVYGGTDKHVCCTNIPECTAAQGRIVRGDYGRTCECGCENDDDCNTDWYNPLGRKRRCLSGKCEAAGQCFSVDQVSVVIEDTNGGRLSEESLRGLIQKIKGELLLSENDKVRIVFEEERCKSMHADGMADNKEVIYIRSSRCCQIGNNADNWSCEATIIHENEHRKDEVNQPLWFKFKTRLASAYQFALTEINAHATGEVTNLRNYYETCYPQKNGSINDVCESDPESAICTTCKFYPRQEYATNYYTRGWAKKYYQDKTYFEPKNCEGLRGKMERDFIDSYTFKKSYVDGTITKQLGSVIRACIQPVDTEKDLEEDVEKIKGLLGCKGWKENTGITDLPELIAELYTKNSTLCMSPSEFASCRHMNLGFSRIHTCAIMYDFLSANPDINPSKIPTECNPKCEKETYELSE